MLTVHGPCLLSVQLMCFSFTGKWKLGRSFSMLKYADDITIPSVLFITSLSSRRAAALFLHVCVQAGQDITSLQQLPSAAGQGFTRNATHLAYWVFSFFLRTNCFQITLNWSAQKLIIQEKKTKITWAIAGHCQFMLLFPGEAQTYCIWLRFC